MMVSTISEFYYEILFGHEVYDNVINVILFFNDVLNSNGFMLIS